MEIDDKNLPEGVGIKTETPPPETPEQKLISECNRIAMVIMGSRMDKSHIGWDFVLRRKLEQEIEKEICLQLFKGDVERAPSVKLKRDKKTKLVYLDLQPKKKMNWKERMS